MTTGHEERFRRLYADEAAGRLLRLASGARALERDEDPTTVHDVIDGMVREAHTLKGGAMVVGFPQVARVAHVLEDVLSALRAGHLRAAPPLVTSLLEAVEGLRDLIAGAVEGHEDHGATAVTERIEAAAALSGARTPRAHPD